MLFGVHEGLTPAQTKERFPRVKLGPRLFAGAPMVPRDLVTKLVNQCGPTWDAGLIALWSFKPDINSVLSGAWDARLRELAQFIKDNPDKKVWVIIWHEPENDMSASTYVRLFNRCHDVLKSVHPQLITVHSALTYRYREGGEILDPSDWLTKADVLAADVYSGRSFPLSATLPEHSGFKRWLAGLVGTRSYALTERGFIADDAHSAERVDTMRREAHWLTNSVDGQRCIAYELWNTPGAENDPLIVLDTAGEAAGVELMNAVTGFVPEPTEPEPETHTVTCPLCKGEGQYTFTLNEDEGTNAKTS